MKNAGQNLNLNYSNNMNKKIRVHFDDQIIEVDQVSHMNGCLKEVIVACAERIKSNKNDDFGAIEFPDGTFLYNQSLTLFQL